MLLDFIEAFAEIGRAESCLLAIEQFGSGIGQWLKVAADCKAQLVESAIRRHRARRSEACLEMGTFVGYTAIRLARWLHTSEPAPGRGVSLEVDPVHALLTRHNLSRSHLTPCSDVWVGQALDVIPRLAEDLGGHAMVFAFMDHRGTRFHSDWARLQTHGVTLPTNALVCDNTLKPGAPLCLWLVTHSKGSPSAVHWSMNEFAHWNSEDWMLVHDGSSHC